jgi:hypothetical protein
MKVIAPPGQATVAGPAPAVEPVAETTPVVDVDIQNEPQDNTVTPATDPAILMLASNDDLNVETIARCILGILTVMLFEHSPRQDVFIQRRERR